MGLGVSFVGSWGSCGYFYEVGFVGIFYGVGCVDSVPLAILS